MSQTHQQHLLAFSIGPVQGFIAAARKTRDLWFGSHLLSEIAKATAIAIAKNGGNLIFPGVADQAELERDTKLSVANVILAIVDDPKSFSTKAEDAAKERWKQFADTAKEAIEKIGGKEVLRLDLWDSQINDFLEFHAVWTPLNDNDYQKSRNRAMRLLAGRKACRDFDPAQGKEGLPKSSLDGSRETVLNDNLSDKFRRNLHLREGEQLDAIGVVKRFAGGHQYFPSLGLIAIDPMIRTKKKELQNEDKNIDWDDFDELNEMFPGLTEKSPYLAILIADGDKMGKAISERKSIGEHRILSQKLSAFAEEVPNIFKGNNGECVYSGGDDVLGFVPLDTALKCARELHDEFAGKLKDYGVSLSVGLVVGHYHEMLETLIDYSRKAEKAAKAPTFPDKLDDLQFGDRDGLAVWTYHRSGSPCGIRERWQNNDESLDKRLQEEWAKLFNMGEISMKFPYDLRAFVRLFEVIGKPATERTLAAEMIRTNAVQIAKQKQLKNRYLLDRLEQLDTLESVQRLADEMMIAQTIGEVLHLAGKASRKKEDDHES